jgi:hypothetical protein
MRQVCEVIHECGDGSSQRWFLKGVCKFVNSNFAMVSSNTCLGHSPYRACIQIWYKGILKAAGFI